MTSARKTVLVFAVVGILFSGFRIWDAMYLVEAQRQAERGFEAAKKELAELEAAPAPEDSATRSLRNIEIDNLRRTVSYGPKGIGGDSSPWAYAGIPIAITAGLFALFFALGKKPGAQGASPPLLDRFGRLRGITIVSALVTVVAVYAAVTMLTHVVETRDRVHDEEGRASAAQSRLDKVRFDAKGKLAAGEDENQFEEDLLTLKFSSENIRSAKEQLTLGYALSAAAVIVALGAGLLAFRTGRSSPAKAR